MSSDLYVLDGSFHHGHHYLHSSPDMVSYESDLFFSDPLSPFCDPNSIDVLQEFSTNENSQNPIANSNSLQPFSQAFLSSSPPSLQLEGLSLYQPMNNHLQPLANGTNLGNNYASSLGNGYGYVSGWDDLEVKIEECQVGYESSYNNHPFMPHSYSGGENVVKTMQRSLSSNSFEGKPGGGIFFQPRFDTLLESPSYQTQALSSPENSFIAGHLRRVCSTGDLQNTRPQTTTQRSFSSPLATEGSFIDQGNFKVGRYSAEERKERISKYRAKRNQRNFTKTIKYACRKTLADNRPRIRGRFARNDETGEIPKAICSAIDEDDDELWFEGHEEEDNGRPGGRGGEGIGFVGHFGQPQFQQYYGY